MDEKEQQEIDNLPLEWLKVNYSRVCDSKDHYSSPRLSSEYLDCSMPLTFDQFNFCSFSCKYCVTGDTRVASLGKSKFISEVKVGDKIISYNVIDKKLEVDEVIDTMSRKVSDLFELELENGEKLKITSEHPVYVKSKGWVPVRNLVKGDDIIYWKLPFVAYQKFTKNPMFNLESIKKYTNSMNKLREEGKLLPYWTGKKRPNIAELFRTDVNPMKNPVIYRKVVAKARQTLAKQGGVSEGQLKLRSYLKDLKLSFKEEYDLPSEKAVYYLDFYLPKYNVCLEYDGHLRHYYKDINKDKLRDNYLLYKYGIKTLRINRDLVFVENKTKELIGSFLEKC